MTSKSAATRTLDLTTIAFSGVHLIEASAGTGKTYNITRLFVRALLEKKLTVADILVVTFTEAATQELRGRIGEYLSDLCNRWGQPSQDTFEQWLFEHHDANEARLALTLAVQDLDRAEIHTIHGFCSRVLREQAFQSGEPFDQQVETDGAWLLLEATRDVYRGLVEDEALYEAVHDVWPTPEACIDDLRACLENPLISLPGSKPYDLPDEHALGKLLAEVRQSIATALAEDRKKNKDAYSAMVKKFADWMARFEPVLEAHLTDDGRVSHRVLGMLIRLGELPKAGNSNLLKPLLREDAPLGRLKALLEKYQAYRKGDALGYVVREVRARTEHLRRQRNVLDFSAMIHRVHQAVAHQPNAPLTRSLAERYPVMLVDEFQDTDSAQFDIFYTLARSRAGNCLFMIGDPKQSIYSFRGGDVHTYLRARAEANYAWTLDGNWRSTPDMVEAYNELFSFLPNAFGESGITYERVKARKSPQELGEIVDEGGHPAALQVPVLEVPDSLREKDKKGSLKPPSADVIRAIAAQWCAQEARRLLRQARIRTSEGERPLQGKDLAFLVRSHTQAEEVIRALKAVGLTAASAKSKKTVFESTEAQHLRLFLRGVLYAEQESCFLTALATPWVGLDAHSLYTLPEQAETWQRWYEQFAHWRTLWQRGRLLAMLHEAFFGNKEHPGGYRIASDRPHRSLTNLFHLAELMQAEALNRRAPEDQLDWLEAAMAHPKSQPEGAELRLERDDDVITVMTMHGAKGLEFPVVFLPFADTKPPQIRGKTCVIPWGSGLQVDYLEDDLVKQRHAQEVREENMRLFYVAMTRPIYRCYMPWLGVEASSKSKETSLAPSMADALGGSGVCENLMALADQHPRAIHVTEPIVMDPQAAQEDDVPELASGPGIRPEARVFDGNIDRQWRVLSFTALARGMHEPEQQVRPERDDDDVARREPAQPLPLRFRMRPGAQTGEILHALLEHADFTRPDWPALVDAWAQGAGLDAQEQDELALWMDEVIRTPVPLGDDTVRLADLPNERTLREAEFFFPAHAPVRAIERALSRWRGGQPVHLKLDTVTGMMRGFIDLIFEANGRYWVADYKSTWLGETLEDYSADAIARNMQMHHYDLQGLIYSVALHRLLRQRLPGYDPARHLGGMVYLYLRGMAPEGGTGVHVQPVPADILARWDALFQGEEVPA